MTVAKPVSPKIEPTPDLRIVVRACIDQMGWLTPSDQATVALALHYAEMIEIAEDRAKVLGWHGPHLLNTLRALGGTPADRKSIGVEERVGGRLAELRSLRIGNPTDSDTAEA